MNAAHVSVPAFRWYIHQLALIQPKAVQFKSQWEGKEQSEWLSLCWSSLQWAAHLLPYTRFLPDEASVHKVLVSMLLELAPSVQVADLMAEFFHDNTNIHPELQERLDKILAQWQSIIVKPEEDGRSVRNSQESFDGRKSVTFHDASPRGESLSVYFLKQQQVIKRVLKKKHKVLGFYQEFVFERGVELPRKLSIGSQPCETKVSYFDFLDMFCAISFSKILDKLQTKDKASSLPLLRCLCEDLVNQEMNFFVENVAAQAHKKQGLVILAGGLEHYASHDDLAAEQRHAQRFANKPAGLFRGRSIMDYSPERDHAAVTRETGEPSQHEPVYAHIQQKTSHRVVSPRQPRLTEAANQWQLTVNFGKRYTSLQQLLEWLEVWSNKRHGFGLGRQEAQLKLKVLVDRMESEHTGLEQSLPQSTLREEEEVRTAYEQVLDGSAIASSVHNNHRGIGDGENMSDADLPAGDGGLAQLLQNVIRKEMRRIVQSRNPRNLEPPFWSILLYIWYIRLMFSVAARNFLLLCDLQ
nr:hypothetical protein BaRGS_028345 [Batillaria attramentaria]